MTDIKQSADTLSMEEQQVFTALTDTEWDDATARVRNAALRYQHVDFGHLAGQAVDTYLESRSREQAAARPQMSADWGGASAATSGMITAFTAQHSDRGRWNSIVLGACGGLAPLAVLLMVVYVIHSFVGWSAVSTGLLASGFLIVAAASAALVVSFVREGSLMTWAPRQGALAMSIGAIAATLVSPLAIQQFRTNERTGFELANTAVLQLLTDDLAAGISPLHGVQRLAATRDRYDVVTGKPTQAGAVSVQAKGVPGYLTVKLDGPGAASVVWSQPLRREVTQSLVREGQVEAAADGSRRFVTDDGGSYAVGSSIAVPPNFVGGKAVGQIDPATRRLTRLTPSTVTAGMAK